MTRFVLSLALVATVGLVAVGCSGSGTSPSPSEPPASDPPIASPSAPVDSPSAPPDGMEVIVELNTVGGVAPTTPACAAANAGAKTTVPYSADYVFFKQG